MGVITQSGVAVSEPRAGGRNAVNFWIDLLTAVAFSLLLSTSFIMKFILPPGTCDEVGKVKVWLGHSRHWWGDIHFWGAMLMLALIIIHIWLHWSWVKGLWGKLLGRYYAPQSLGMLVLMGGLLAVPFIVPFQYMPVEGGDVAAVAAEVTDTSGAETIPAAAAPCGVEGLSCDTCPAADDRLFGGGCGEDEEAATEAVVEDTAAEPAGEFELLGPAPEDEPAADSACGADSACATCPSAASCSSAAEGDE